MLVPRCARFPANVMPAVLAGTLRAGAMRRRERLLPFSSGLRTVTGPLGSGSVDLVSAQSQIPRQCRERGVWMRRGHCRLRGDKGGQLPLRQLLQCHQQRAPLGRRERCRRRPNNIGHAVGRQAVAGGCGMAGKGVQQHEAVICGGGGVNARKPRECRGRRGCRCRHASRVRTVRPRQRPCSAGSPACAAGAPIRCAFHAGGCRCAAGRWRPRRRTRRHCGAAVPAGPRLRG